MRVRETENERRREDAFGNTAVTQRSVEDTALSILASILSYNCLYCISQRTGRENVHNGYGELRANA